MHSQKRNKPLKPLFKLVNFSDFALMSRLRYHIRILFVAILLLNLCGIIILQAQTGEMRRPFQAVRNLGMGNAGIALSFDENALFYNPAGLVGVLSLIHI